MAVGRPLVTIVLAVGRPLVIILMAVGRPLAIILMAAGRPLVIIVLAVGRLLMGFDDYLASGWSTVFFCRRIFHNFYVCVIACVLMPAVPAAAQSQARHNPGPILPDATNGPGTIPGPAQSSASASASGSTARSFRDSVIRTLLRFAGGSRKGADASLSSSNLVLAITKN